MLKFFEDLNRLYQKHFQSFSFQSFDLKDPRFSYIVLVPSIKKILAASSSPAYLFAITGMQKRPWNILDMGLKFTLI